MEHLVSVADNYGLAAYGLYLFLATIWWSMHWGEEHHLSCDNILLPSRPGDATACPYNHFESCVEGTMTKQETIVRTIAQVIGGVAVFRLIQVLWGIEIAETHVGRSHSAIYNVCTADLAGEGDDIIYSLNLQILLLYLSNNTMIIDYI